MEPGEHSQPKAQFDKWFVPGKQKSLSGKEQESGVMEVT
jgi:hypothetical protein